LESCPAQKGVHTEFENDFLLSFRKRKGQETWIEKEGKYNESYREHYFPGEKEKFLEELYNSKIRLVWDFFESIGVFVDSFEVDSLNNVKGLPNKESINFVKEQNLKRGIYKNN
jgi:hypothetical protein